jgi:ubiquinone/menaquinone biosynthesis C-methylase UbiE
MIRDPEFDAYQGFVLAAKLYWTSPMFQELKARYEDRLARDHKGLPPGPDRVQALIGDDTTTRFFGFMERHLQRMKYSGRLGLHPAHAVHREAIEGQLNAPVPAGMLEIDPDFRQPKYYSSIDIHQHPGGVWSDEIAGVVYERGARSTTPLMSKDKDLHQRFTDIVLARKRPARLLDMGCGFGKSTRSFWEELREGEVVGVDLAAPCLKLAAQDAAAAQARNVRFVQRSATDTKMPDASFGVVTSTMLLHEMPPPVIKDTLQEAWRVLEPGGWMVHLDFLPPDDEFLTWMHYGHGRRNNEPFMEPLARMGIDGEMERIGFTDVEIMPFEEMAGALALQGKKWRFPWTVIAARKPAA